MMQCTCDICGNGIFKVPFGELAHTLREESSSRDKMIIKTRSKDGSCTNYDDVCGECTAGINTYIASRKVIGK